ncbi:hypothetical protein J7K74_01900 [Candidatus Woesearchaeota archaeon]|nr:hypothetical protein [Candidatus Woesearchaeota archaeon]
MNHETVVGLEYLTKIEGGEERRISNRELAETYRRSIYILGCRDSNLLERETERIAHMNVKIYEYFKQYGDIPEKVFKNKRQREELLAILRNHGDLEKILEELRKKRKNSIDYLIEERKRTQ